MKWVAWRQSRLELIIGLVFLAGLAAFLVPVALQKLALFRDLGLADMNPNSTGYGVLSQQFINSCHWFNSTFTILVGLVPLIVGALLAIPIAVEFEQRTYRLAWTQSITRGRWLATKLGFALIAAIAFSALFSVLMSWWLGPQNRLLGAFNNFILQGIVPVAYAVFAFSVALFTGVLSRRTVLALVVALMVSIAAVAGVGSELRPHYMTPLEQTTTLPSGSTIFSLELPNMAWEVEKYPIDAAGNRLSDGPAFNGTGEPTGQVVEYQPADRYWPFQGIESSMFLGMSAVLLGTTVWVVKRRTK